MNNCYWSCVWLIIHLKIIRCCFTKNLKKTRNSSFFFQQNRGPAQKPSSPAAHARYLVWMMGRLRLTLKALYCEQQGMCTAMHRIHHTTQGVSAPPHHFTHLTAWDAYLLRHPKQLKKVRTESSHYIYQLLINVWYMSSVHKGIFAIEVTMSSLSWTSMEQLKGLKISSRFRLMSTCQDWCQQYWSIVAKNDNK